MTDEEWEALLGEFVRCRLDHGVAHKALRAAGRRMDRIESLLRWGDDGEESETDDGAD